MTQAFDRNRERYRRALDFVSCAETIEDARRIARLTIAGWTPTRPGEPGGLGEWEVTSVPSVSRPSGAGHVRDSV